MGFDETTDDEHTCGELIGEHLACFGMSNNLMEFPWRVMRERREGVVCGGVCARACVCVAGGAGERPENNKRGKKR